MKIMNNVFFYSYFLRKPLLRLGNASSSTMKFLHMGQGLPVPLEDLSHLSIQRVWNRCWHGLSLL